MAKFKFDCKGFEEALETIHNLELDSDGLFKRSVYDGADVMGQAIRSAVQSLKVGKGGHVTEVQKQGLLDGFGFTHMKLKDGTWITRIGFDGYNADGQPNPLIANIVNSGTSKYKATHFVDNAVRQAKSLCQQAMKQRLESDIDQVMKGK